jgi:2-polyprenyl-3-methyl-5-hydroxy-6-metoxy-1,4-benzoquinol methylase
MKNTDKDWIENWSVEKFEPIVKNYQGIIVGTDNEPDASICLSSFAKAMGPNWKEGMKILDYGCGSARFSNFMSKRLENFEYWGIEKYISDYTKDCIVKATELFAHDSRVRLGFTQTPFHEKAINSADTVILLSVFTHTSIEETHRIIKSLIPIVERGGRIVFSMIHGDQYTLSSGGIYGFDDNWFVTHNTREQVEDISNIFNVKIQLEDTFDAGFIHSIYSIMK